MNHLFLITVSNQKKCSWQKLGWPEWVEIVEINESNKFFFLLCDFLNDNMNQIPDQT